MTTSTERGPEVVLTERAFHLAFLATERLYERQPELWDLGEHGRSRTLEDFGHHFRALASGANAFRVHVDYCYELFAARGFPLRWLEDAWGIMSEICEESLDQPILTVALQTLSVAMANRR